jgi:ribonuclease HI
MTYKLQFDGCCEPNPGSIGIGVVVWNDDNEKIIELSEQSGIGTNNQAEYIAVKRGLEELSKIYSGSVLVQGDSQLIIKQLQNEWKVRKKELKILYTQVKSLESKFQKVKYEWIKRKENKEADIQSAKALGLNLNDRDEKRVNLQVGNSYEFVFDDDNRITTTRDQRYNRDVQRYYVKEASRNSKTIKGTYFETGSKKLIGLLNLMKPLKNKKLRIIPTKSQNWIDYMVEEIDN